MFSKAQPPGWALLFGAASQREKTPLQNRFIWTVVAAILAPHSRPSLVCNEESEPQGDCQCHFAFSVALSFLRLC
jgi:hypothetical protein